MPSIIGGQIEQESCISLTHSRCWNPNVELKTSREYGFGLGQITIAKDKFGKVRFNNFDEAKRMFPSALKEWKWEDRFDPSYQMTAMVLMDRNLYNKVQSLTPRESDQLAFMLAAYNGGTGGLLQDRKLCEGSKGCDPTKWFGHVAANSFKNKIKLPGYGESAFDINRGYVDQIMNKRRLKYVPYMEKYVIPVPPLVIPKPVHIPIVLEKMEMPKKPVAPKVVQKKSQRNKLAPWVFKKPS